ncbi:SDR family oxidoreductase, partial [Salmonella enterica subsp. enterica serovar Lubbock]|nr:SDR family oxidoreductase [Salmonella enterica subsp. enterica serovar Lubbock]
SDIEPGSEPSIPIARPGSTHEIASLVAWLCSEGASYTTGQSLSTISFIGVAIAPGATALTKI